MDARVKWLRIKENPQHNTICFEPLEPRLLLSGTWGAGADSPVSESSDFEQATVATVMEAETGQTGAAEGAIDLLGAAPTMHLIDSDVADTDAAPVSESTAAQAESSESSNAPDSSDVASIDESLSQQLEAQYVRELIIVNDNVGDYEQLLADLQDGDGNRIIDVAVIDADGDGIQQVSDILSQYSDLSAVHFITHGADNRINIGGTWLNESSLPQYENAVSKWGDALNEDGDLLFYGCNFASGGAGQDLLNRIADLTGADVAASDDPTGSTQLGGDWDLEFNSGAIETQVVVDAGAQAGWEHLMVAPDDLQATTATNGGLQLNHDGGNDAYLIADDGGSLLGGLSQMTFETRFSTTHTMTDNVLVSYAEAGDADEFSIFIDSSRNLNVSLAGSSITSLSGIFDYSTIEDGNTHALALTWDNTAGDWEIFVDGVSVDSGTGLGAAATIAGGGELVFGQEQDSVDGGYDPTQRFTGTLYDARFFNTVRSGAEIATSYQTILPYDQGNMIANWTFDNFSTGGVVTDKVSGNNLTVQHAAGGGFSASAPELTMSVDENAVNGTVVGSIIGNDAERQAQITTLLGGDPALSYSSITNKFYKTVASSVTWTTAESSAQSTTLSGVSGQLVTIRSAAENEIVYNLVQLMGGHSHIGASDATTEDEWHWQSGGADAEQFWQGDETGSAVNGSYQHWSTGQPNDLFGSEDYAGMDVTSGGWFDLNGMPYNYIVEWDADDVLDATNELTYSIQSQTVSGAFTIDSDNGVITVADGSLLDYETNPTHTLTVRVTDVNETLTYDKVFTISLNNINEDPVITSSAAVNIKENQTAATTATATDVDGDTPTFSISGGADMGFFSINSTTGDLTFDSAPDYENPLDANTDNVYEVEVTADDGNGATDTQSISVTVTDEVELPTVNGPAGSTVAEDAGPLVFSTATSNRIWISNIAASDTAEVELSVPTGVLTLSGTTGLTFSQGDGTGDSTMVFSGTAADINAALDGLSFQPDADYNGNLQIEIKAENKRLSTVGHYSFDNAGDPGNDSSPSGANDATLNGDATVVADATRGDVLQFDGSGDSLQVAGHFGVESTNAVTMAAWVDLDGFDTNGAEIFSMGNDVVVRLIDGATNDSYYIGYYNGSSFIGTGAWLPGAYADIAASGWVHLAYSVEHRTDNRTYTSFYVNGVFAGGGSNPDTGIHLDNGPDTYFGTHGNGGAGYDFQGRMDEVCVFDRALSLSEITALVGEKTTAYVDVAVTAVNDAPVLTPASPTLTTITEDDTGNAGQTVASIVGASISDTDSGAVEGIAITGLSSGNGGWEYSTDGGTNWNAVGAVADSSALLLRSTDLVRFVPDGQNATTGSITYRAWDQTSGSFGTMVDAGTNGGTTAFSTATDTAGITVTAVNDRPVISSVSNLDPIFEDDVSSSGTLVSALISTSDVDSGAVSGMAVYTVDNTDGSWEFSTNGGSTWAAFGSPDPNNVRLLAADALTYVRFVPNANFNGTVTGLSYRAWDQTVGLAGGTIDMFANWGSNAFSLGAGSSSVTVFPANDAPVLTPASPTLTSITEDDTGNAGQTVASIVGASISDVDSGAVEGIAITGLVSGNGSWEYSINGGTNWNAVGAVADSSALLLRSTDLVRFVPDGQNATTGSITYRAWDQTSGSFGTMVDAGTNGGTTAFSTATDTAGITVTAVNDAPVLTGDLSATIDESGTYYLTGTDLGYTDPDDVDAGVTFTVSNITNGNGIYVAGVGLTTTFTGADLTAGSVRFVHDGSETTTASFDVNVEDGDEDGSTPVDSTFNFTVNPVNDNPSITASFDLASIDEDDVSNSGTLVSALISTSDPDIGAVSGMAVWSVNNTSGSWEFSTDGGSTWSAFGSPWTNNVRLLAADALTYVRFVPNADFNGTVSPGLRFMAWDQTIGTAGGTIDMVANLSSNAFSFGAGSSSITVNPVNDAPQATNLSAAETYTEDTALNLTDIVVTDVDSANVTVTLTLTDVAAGTLSTGTSGAVTATFAGGVWTASGAIADVNTLLAGVTFNPAANYNSNFTIATSVSDGVAAPVTGTKAMTGTAVNHAPNATNLSAAETYTEDTALNLIDIVVTDVDSANVTVTLTLSDTSAGTLSTGTSGAVTSTFAGGVWTASGAIADVNTLLAGVTFTPAADYNSNFTIATSVSDGVAAPVTGTKVMTATAVNDPSVLAADSQTVDEDNAATGNVLANDSDVDDTLSVATFTVNGDATVYNGGDTATIAGIGTVQILSDGSYTFTPNADWNGAMPQVTYTTNTGSSATLDITVEDTDDSTGTGGGGGGGDDDDGSGKDDDKGFDEDEGKGLDEDGDTDPELPPVPPPDLPDLPPGPPPPHPPPADPDVSQDGLASIILDDEDSPSDMAAVFNDLMRGPARPETIRAIPSAGSFISPEALIQSLDRIQQEVDLAALVSKSVQANLIVGVTTGLTVSVFAGYVIWAFRGASLLVSAVSAMPMWRCFDPLPVLLGGDKKRSEEEEEEEMTPEVEDAEDNVNELLGLEQMDSSRQVVIPEESELI